MTSIFPVFSWVFPGFSRLKSCVSPPPPAPPRGVPLSYLDGSEVRTPGPSTVHGLDIYLDGPRWAMIKFIQFIQIIRLDLYDLYLHIYIYIYIYILYICVYILYIYVPIDFCQKKWVSMELSQAIAGWYWLAIWGYPLVMTFTVCDIENGHWNSEVFPLNMVDLSIVMSVSLYLLLRWAMEFVN